MRISALTIKIIIYIMTIICFQLHYRPADIPHSTLRTMAKDVRRAMLPNNDEVLNKSFAEGIEDHCSPSACAYDDFASCFFQLWTGIKRVHGALEDDKVKTEKHCCVLNIYCYVLYILFHLYALTQLNQLYLDIMLVSLWSWYIFHISPVDINVV